MAIISTIICSQCNKERQIIHNPQRYPKICDICAKQNTEDKRRIHFEMLDDLTIEQRLRLVEEWVYDYRPPRSIHDITF